MDRNHQQGSKENSEILCERVSTGMSPVCLAELARLPLIPLRRGRETELQPQPVLPCSCSLPPLRPLPVLTHTHTHTNTHTRTPPFSRAVVAMETPANQHREHTDGAGT